MTAGGLTCCGYLSQCILVTVNVLFSLLGIGFIVAGCLLRFSNTFVIDHIDELLTEIQISTLNVDMSSIIKSLAIAIIVIGGVVFIVGAIGIIGACCRLRGFLVIYAMFLILLLAAQVTAVVLTFIMKSDIDRELKQALKKTLKDNYAGDEGKDDVTKAWNYMFLTFECCGVDNYMDLHNITTWDRNSVIGKYETPLYCCHEITGEYPKVCLPSGEKADCALHPKTNNSNFEKGCYNEIMNWLTTYGTIEIIIGACFWAIEIFCIIFAFCLCRDIGRNVGKKYEQNDSDEKKQEGPENGTHM